jgi:hypothetical protein
LAFVNELQSFAHHKWIKAGEGAFFGCFLGIILCLAGNRLGNPGWNVSGLRAYSDLSLSYCSPFLELSLLEVIAGERKAINYQSEVEDFWGIF